MISVSKNIHDLENKLNTAYVNYSIVQTEKILMESEIKVCETILEHRNGVKLNSEKLKNLNIFGSFMPEIQYDLKEINDVYNYQLDDMVVEGYGWRFALKPDEKVVSEESFQKTLGTRN